MSAINCKYHPTVPALWECLQCNIELCSTCVKQDEADATKAICPVCNHYLNKVGLGNIIPPFWTRIHTFFIYPASLQTLLFIVMLAVATTILLQFPLFGPLISLVLLLVFMRYAYAVLDSVAFGHSTPPPISLDLLTTKMGQPIKQILVFVVVGFAFGFLGRYLHWSIMLLLLFFFIFSIPATIMILALENSFSRAINPVMWMSVIGRIGWSYLLLCIFLFLLSIGSGVAVSMFGFVGANMYFVLIYFVINMYFTLIMFSMMGYVLYQYHEDFGFNVSDDAAAPAATGAAPATADPVVPVGSQQANILISEGKLDEAAALLKESINKDYENVDLHDQYHNLLKLRQNSVELLEHGQRYIGLLMSNRKLKRALEVLKECLKIDKNFRLDEPAHVYGLAEYAMNTRANNTALALMNGYANKYPGHPDTPKVYFLAAKVLCEGLKQDEKAKQLLNNILTKYPEHELVPDIKQYLSLIDQLKGS